jgi:hypothetical protein
MKNYLLLLSILLSTTGIMAQTSDFAPVGARWIYTEANFALQGVPYIMEVTGKENFKGKWCSRFEYQPNSLDKLYLYTGNDTVFYYSFLSEQFEMLYDFSAEVGDSWIIGGLEGYNPDNPLPYAPDTITVDSISHLYISGDTLKVWHIHNTFWFDWGDRIIEKVGNDGLPLPRFGLFETSVWGLRCFETSETFFQFVPYPCDTIFSTTSATNAPVETLKIHVSPNPATDLIQLPWEGPLESLQLFDALGQQMPSGSFHLSEGRLEVPVGHLPAGMYFLHLWAQGRVRSGWFVKR